MALEIGIGADISELKDKLAEAQLALEKLRKQKATDIKLGLDVKNLQTQINDAKANIRGLSAEVNKNASAMNNHSKATANGGNTLMQFSRIAQDAPYGIIGIGNNLTATAESFGHLAKSSGGAGNALKAVVSSMTGVGGVLLAVSLVTTGLTILAQKGLTISDVFNKLSGNFNQAAQDIKKAYEESSKSALGEVASIKAVIAVARDETASRRDRLAAVNELQSKYPAYFGNLTQEQIKYGDLSKVIKSVSDALINKAVAEKVSEKAGDAAYKQLQLNAQLLKAKENLTKAEENYLKAARSTSGATVEPALLAIDRAKAGLQGVRDRIIENQKQLSQLQSILNKTTATGISQKAAEADLKAAKKTAAATAKILTPKEPKFKNPNPNFNGGNGFIGGGIVNPNSGIVTPDLGVDEAAIIAAEKTRAGLLLQEKLLQDFSTNAEGIVFGSLVDTFGNLGTAIGEALASGGNVFNAIGKTLLAGLGKFISEMGGLLIQYGTMALVKGKLDLAMKAGGKVAIAAGAGAIAVGIAAKAVGAAISAKANAGIGGGGESGGGGTGQRGSISSGADVSSPTSSVSSGGSFNNSGGTVVFEIAGQKLIGVLNNTTQGNLRLGGSGLVG
jgi:hypothetical protein